MKKIIKNFVILFLFIITLTGCNSKTEEDTKDKITAELNYLDTKIIDISNKLNNLLMQNYSIAMEEVPTENFNNSTENESKDEQKETKSQENVNNTNEEKSITVTEMKQQSIIAQNENDIDWNTIKAEIETINEAWTTIILDLTNFNGNNQDILNFSSTLNDVLLCVKSENKEETLVNISKLYSFIPKFEEQIGQEKSVKQVKSFLLNSYSLLEKEDWTEIEKNINMAEETFKNILNNVEYIKNQEFKTNKTYILIKELQNSLVYKDKKLFLIKYKNLIESINML